MTEHMFTTRNSPETRNMHKDVKPETRRMVRVYRCSPESVALQIRGDKRYSHVALTFDEAREIAAALMQEVPRKEIGE